MNKSVLYILCGLPFSGKTTLAKEILKQADLTFVSIDEIKFAHGFTWTEDENMSADEWQMIFDESYTKTLEALKAGKSVLYDSANQSRESRDELRKIAKQANADSKVIFMNIPESVVRERWQENQNSKERFHLPERFFNAAFSNYESPTEDESVLIFGHGDNAGDWIIKNITQTDRSFGVIPIFKQEEPLFLIIQHKAGHWAFPKGHPQGDEAPLQTAVRELGEETGITDI